MTIFNMDEIIIEALEYVAPKKVDETAVDPKAKQAKGKPNKTNEDMSLTMDRFEGKNTSTFKEIATNMKNQFFSDYEGELAQKKDLITLVPDDAMLVNLFVERLKLEYAGVDLEHNMEEIEAGVTREAEIEAQLAEMEVSKDSADPAAAKGKPDKKAAKGGDKKAPDELLKDELEAIKKFKMKGWILLDFPKSLS